MMTPSTGQSSRPRSAVRMRAGAATAPRLASARRQIETLEKRMAEIEQHQGIRVELDQYVEEKKQEIMRIFSLEEEFSVGEGI